MILKKIFLLLTILLFPSCGYTPIYSNNVDHNLGISILSIEGNKELNKKLNIQLNKHITEDKKDSFKIKIETNFQKKIISKDSKGNATNFELNASVLFTILFDNQEKKVLFNESSKIKSKDDSFEQKKYEDIIISNFAKSFEQKLILEINNL